MNEQQPEPYRPLREDWQSALAVVAHPDDMEYGAAAAVARWTSQGKQVVYVMVTSGEAGIDTLAPEHCRPIREAEQVASAALVGVPVVEFLGHPDGVLEYGLTLRRDISRAIRRHRPEIVLTANFRDTYGGVVPNQADHIAVGRSVLDAIRDAGNRWVFPDLLDEGHEPWGGVRELWAAGSPRPRTPPTPPTSSTSAWPRCAPTRRTWRASAATWRTRRTSWRASPARPAPGWAPGTPRRSRCCS